MNSSSGGLRSSSASIPSSAARPNLSSGLDGKARRRERALCINFHFQDCGREVIDIAFKSKVAGIQKADIRIWHVTLERLGSWWNEEGVVLSPYHQQWRPVCAEVLLIQRIAFDIRFIVELEVGLNIHHPRAGKESRIQPISLGLDRGGITHPLNVGLTDPLERHTFPNCLTNGRRRLPPIGT